MAPLGPRGLLLPRPVLGPPWRASWGGSRHGRSQPGPRLRLPPWPPTHAPARWSPAEPSRTAQLRASPATISLFYNSVPRHLQNPAPSSSGLTAPLNFKQTPQSGPPGRATFRTRLTARPPRPSRAPRGGVSVSQSPARPAPPAGPSRPGCSGLSRCGDSRRARPSRDTRRGGLCGEHTWTKGGHGVARGARGGQGAWGQLGLALGPS